MRIAIAGLHNEASGFSLHRADAAFFRWIRGAELLAQYDFTGENAEADIEFVPILVAMGGASGPVLPEVFDEVEAEIVGGLRAALAEGPLDGIYLHMHGAVGVEGRSGAEEQLLASIRAVVGAEPVIAMSMDPHGNLSRELIGHVDIASCHRFSPHVDNKETPGRVVSQLIDAIRSGIRPVTAWVYIPSLLPGERTSTVVEPGRSVFHAVTDAIESEPAVRDAGIWVGFAWADEARNSAAALATGSDEAAVRATAEKLARGYWEAREEFAIVSDHVGSYAEALDHLLASPPAPLFISDSGDNVTAGSAGDITFCLEATLAHEALAASGKKILITGIMDPDALDEARVLGPGRVLDAAIGAHVDPRYGAPVPGPWHIDELIDGQQGEGVVGALIHRGNVFVTIQSTRQRFVGAGDPSASHNGAPFAAIVDVSPYDAVVVKNGYLFPTQVAQSGSHFMAITPGGTDLDFDRLEFVARAVPMFPFERSFDPDLTAELIPAWTPRASS
jgi:microcystin degradation protein MlrC